jgi:hypothetical protein
MLATLREDEQEEVLRIIGMLAVDPSLDGICRHVIRTADGHIAFYDGRDVWVSYQQSGNDEVLVVNCGRYRPPSAPMM